MAREQCQAPEPVSTYDADRVAQLRRQDAVVAAAEAATVNNSRMTVIEGTRRRRRREVKEERIAAAAASQAASEKVEIEEELDRTDSLLDRAIPASQETVEIEIHYTLFGKKGVKVFDIDAKPRASGRPRAHSA